MARLTAISPAPSPPDLVDLYVDQGLSLAVIGACSWSHR